jgi:hypothetical protein
VKGRELTYPQFSAASLMVGSVARAGVAHKRKGRQVWETRRPFSTPSRRSSETLETEDTIERRQRRPQARSMRPNRHLRFFVKFFYGNLTFSTVI